MAVAVKIILIDNKVQMSLLILFMTFFPSVMMLLLLEILISKNIVTYFPVESTLF